MTITAREPASLSDVARLLRKVLRRLDRIEARPPIVVNVGATGGAPEPVPIRTPPPARHSPDFRSVHWYGKDYLFTPMQAKVVEQLWLAWKNGTPGVGHHTLLEAADSEQDRLSGVFRDRQGRLHPCWEEMIVSERQG